MGHVTSGAVRVLLIAGMAGAVVAAGVWWFHRNPWPQEATTHPSSVLTSRDIAATYPRLRNARPDTKHGPVQIVGTRCGLVPNESGGQGTPIAGARGATRRIDGSASERDPTVVERTVRLASTSRAEAVVERYRDYLDRCGGRLYGGDWEGTVSSSPWPVPDIGDDAVGVVDLLDDRGGPSAQRVAVVRTGSSIVVVQVVVRDTKPPPPGPVVHLIRNAVAGR